MRLAPAIALAQGSSIYPTAEAGTINTWIYGPLPVLFFWPAAWANTAADALLVAAALNTALIVAAIAIACLGWPAPGATVNERAARLGAFVLCVALWPEIYFAVHSADNLAIACGILANLLLVRAQGAAGLWLAAVVAVAAIACKQTAAGIPLAQVLWLGLSRGWPAAARHAARCAVAGLALGVLAVIGFGWSNLRFVLAELPAQLPWVSDPRERLALASPELIAQIALPLAIMLGARRAFVRSPLLLPALAWACALPLGIASLLKFGGRMNSVYSLVLWLPPVATTLALRWAASGSLAPRLTFSLAAAAIGCARIVEAPRFPLRPQTAAYVDAAQIAASLPGQVWFPLHPLVTLYSEGVYYHDEDGLFVRRITRKGVSPENAAAHLPPAFRAVALREGWTDFQIARSLLPENVRTLTIGSWSVRIVESPAKP